MKTQYVEQLTPDSGSFVDFLQILKCDVKNTKAGKMYLDLTLADRTGSVPAKVWDVPPDFYPAAVTKGLLVKVQAETGTYNDTLQVTVRKIRVLTAEEKALLPIDHFLPCSKRDREQMFGHVLDIAGDMREGTLRDALLMMLHFHRAGVLNAPAAVKKHQPYVGGLLEHITNLIGLTSRVCENYPVLDGDILIAACIVHDIGKIEELDYSVHIGYSRLGNLLGHVALGLRLWAPYAQDLDPETRDHLDHIIVSHHGNLEWGALKVPATREAQVFHLLDMIDSRMGLFDVLMQNTGADGFTPYDYGLGTVLWNGSSAAEVEEPRA